MHAASSYSLSSKRVLIWADPKFDCSCYEHTKNNTNCKLTFLPRTSYICIVETNYDIIIIGGGIVGAATMYKLQESNPKLSILLLEKEKGLADHQTGNNSGVIHSGIYYKPGSLKAINCVNGRRELVEFAKNHDIKYDICGKLIVAMEESELPHGLTNRT